MNDYRVPRIDLRLLLRAGVPSALVLMALVAVLLWRVAILQQASEREDRADQAVVQAATLAADFIRLQNDERAALLLGDRSAGERPRLVARIDRHFTVLYGLLSDPKQNEQLRSIQGTYAEWSVGSDRLLNVIGRVRPGTLSAADLQIPLGRELLRKADSFVQDLRGSRMEASHMNEDAAQSAVLAAIAGMILLLVVLAVSVVWSVSESQRESQLRWELERQNERSREIARVKSEFVTHVSHELRTPLTAVIGLTEMLHDEKAGSVTLRQKQYLQDILTSSSYLLELITGVLDLAKAEAGKIEIHARRCIPASLAREVVQAMEPLAQQKRIALVLDVADAPPAVETDPARFRQILYNYLSNAVKFTPAGGVVRVRIARETGNRFRLEVQDTGRGIDPEDLRRLFVDFSQLDGNHATQRGAGLGLALTKRIVEIQGGTVGVNSARGVGSVFFAVLPLSATVPVAAAKHFERSHSDRDRRPYSPRRAP